MYFRFFGLALIIVSIVCQSPAFAARSNLVQLSATINTTLELSVSTAGGRSFDPSAQNVNVKIGELILSAIVSHGFQLGVYRPLPDGNPDFGHEEVFTLRDATGMISNTYTITMRPQTFAPVIEPPTASNYGAYWNALGAHSVRNVVYDILISTPRKTTQGDTVIAFSDNIMFTLLAL